MLGKALLWLLLAGAVAAAALVLFPGLKYEIYRQLPPKIRWNISYALTDKFVVGMVYFVERNNQLLLVRHSYQDKWALPGGWVDRDESFEESARRELDEELNIRIDDFEVLEVDKVPRSGIINIAIRGRLKDQQIAIRDGEIFGYRFFDLHRLPDDVIYTHKPYLKRYLEARRPPRQQPAEPEPSRSEPAVPER
ncbi:NUDIX domain-containing protein [Microbulbifer bruguierae]|uniref:NUDIX domain-containing protein n=1 Tax=Microbulbifer bruguierae TaxID=3029061 RepID=A0ABY8NAN3_9GAMM|nr:NUDIX domain-containing protein [Microbulbifer bruguierae]WGL15715.1 NUDIX domain-containing protein [Microbulbifer bruguierae]